MKKTLGLAGIVVMAIGCGGAAVHEPRSAGGAHVEAPASSGSAPESTPPKARAWTLPAEPRDPKAPPPEPKDVGTEAWTKASKVKGVPPAAPQPCGSFAKPAAVKPAPTDLSTAMADKDLVKRNAALATIETGKPDLAPVLRAMRAALAPIECADVITDPALSASAKPTGAAGRMMIGISLASKLSRTAANAPVMKDASDKEKVKRFIQGPLRQWMVEQASAIDALSAPASELAGIARGVVAIEAGLADLRLVDRIRSAPTPSTWDAELKAVYEAALDEALEPRKTRGRDAALVGLADFAAAGIVQDARVDRARALLSKLYGGRRIDALDALVLPPADASTSPIPERVLSLVPSEPAKRDAFAQLGLTPPPSPKSARARLEMGKKYWRRVDFVEAAHAASKETGPDAQLVLATSLALAKGPNGAKEMMTAASPGALHLNDTDALDALASEAAPAIAAMAAFDAAHLRSLSAPEGDAAAPYLTDVAARFRKAAGLLEDPAQKKRAEERAADADAAAKVVGKPAGAS